MKSLLQFITEDDESNMNFLLSINKLLDTLGYKPVKDDWDVFDNKTERVYRNSAWRSGGYVIFNLNGEMWGRVNIVYPNKVKFSVKNYETRDTATEQTFNGNEFQEAYNKIEQFLNKVL